MGDDPPFRLLKNGLPLKTGDDVKKLLSRDDAATMSIQGHNVDPWAETGKAARKHPSRGGKNSGETRRKQSPTVTLEDAALAILKRERKKKTKSTPYSIGKTIATELRDT